MEFASSRQHTIATKQLHSKSTRQCAVHTGDSRSFHPGSRGFPPFPGGNYNLNATPGSSFGLPFGWNWNTNTSLGPQNVSLAFSGSSSQQLGTNPSFGPVGGTHPLGQQSSGSQPGSTPQMNVGFNPHSTQSLGGMTGPSQQPLGQVQSLSQFQQTGGNNASLKIHPCYLGKASNNTNNPLTWGHSFLTCHFNNLMSGLVMSLQILPPRGAVTFNLVGINPGALMPLGDPKISGMSLSREDLTPPNKADLPHLTPTNPKWRDIRSFPAKWARIPNRGHIKMRTNSIPECLMVVLGYIEINILITRIPRTHLHQ